MIDWKSAARAFFRRTEAKQRHLDNVLEDTALMRDEMREESFDSWQDAARHWYEVTKRERASLARERLKNAELLQKIEELSSRALQAEEKYDYQRDEAKRAYRDGFTAGACFGIDDDDDDDSQPSGNPGDFAALAERIAYADTKHPRDLPDGEPSTVRGAEKALEKARDALLEEPSWARALNCELCEFDVEFAKGDTDRLADELGDVATVAMRWRRAVLERGKK